MAEAVSVQDVRDVIEEAPGLQLPASFTDDNLRFIIRRKTSRVLTIRGIKALPRKDTLERDLIDDAVLELAVIEVKRQLRPDEEAYNRTLNEQHNQLMQDLRLVESSSPTTGHRVRVVGGRED